MPIRSSNPALHSPFDTRPPGITGDMWGYLVSDTSLEELQTFLTDFSTAIGADLANIRTPDLGANCTYIALDPDQMIAARASGASISPSESKCRAKAFDLIPGSTNWE